MSVMKANVKELSCLGGWDWPKTFGWNKPVNPVKHRMESDLNKDFIIDSNFEWLM